jgi:hypothetical protein
VNIVRLGMIVTLGAIAYYAISIYASLPKDTIQVAATSVTQTATYMCPAVSNSWSGVGMIFVALTAIGGAIVVAAVDLVRRVY